MLMEAQDQCIFCINLFISFKKEFRLNLYFWELKDFSGVFFLLSGNNFRDGYFYL